FHPLTPPPTPLSPSPPRPSPDLPPLIGCTHTHPPLPLSLTEHDVETHEQYFGEPWQVALLLGTDPEEPAAGFFRAGPDEAWTSTPLAFYELLGPESIRPDGKKRSFVTWKNHRAYRSEERRVGKGGRCWEA